MKHWLLGSVLAFALANGAQAAEITLIAPGGIRAAVEQMIPAFILAFSVLALIRCP